MRLEPPKLEPDERLGVLRDGLDFEPPKLCPPPGLAKALAPVTSDASGAAKSTSPSTSETLAKSRASPRPART